MAMNVGGGKGKKRPMGEINVTPMVDVMLVLLVIFMITAPSIKQIQGLEVDLPQLTGNAAQTIVTEDARTLVVRPDGTVATTNAENKESGYDAMAPLIDDLKLYKTTCEKDKKKAVVVIAGDREAKWERIMQTWNAVKTAGISDISFQVADSGSAGDVATSVSLRP